MTVMFGSIYWLAVTNMPIWQKGESRRCVSQAVSHFLPPLLSNIDEMPPVAQHYFSLMAFIEQMTIKIEFKSQLHKYQESISWQNYSQAFHNWIPYSVTTVLISLLEVMPWCTARTHLQSHWHTAGLLYSPGCSLYICVKVLHHFIKHHL